MKTNIYFWKVYILYDFFFWKKIIKYFNLNILVIFLHKNWKYTSILLYTEFYLWKYILLPEASTLTQQMPVNRYNPRKIADGLSYIYLKETEINVEIFSYKLIECSL